VESSCECGNELSGSIKYLDVLEYLEYLATSEERPSSVKIVTGYGLK
jgi:hypothetical protein